VPRTAAATSSRSPTSTVTSRDLDAVPLKKRKPQLSKTSAAATAAAHTSTTATGELSSESPSSAASAAASAMNALAEDSPAQDADVTAVVESLEHGSPDRGAEAVAIKKEGGEEHSTPERAASLATHVSDTHTHYHPCHTRRRGHPDHY
jgi:hypothetical protein